MILYSQCLLLVLVCYCVWVSALPSGRVPKNISDVFCKGAVRGYAMVPWDCTGYIHCESRTGIANWIDCPQGLFFDLTSSTCEWFSMSCTKEALGMVAATWCPKRPNLVFAHPSSCAMFYNCSKIHASPEAGLLQYEDECIYPNVFDAESMQCRLASFISIGFCTYVPTGPCDYKRGCKQTPSDVCTVLTDGAHPLPNTAFTTSYINCAKGKLTDTLKCNAGQVFDPLKRVCTSQFRWSVLVYCQKNPSAKFHDPFNCAKFYDCSKAFHAVGLNLFQAECEYMYLFDIKSVSCVRYDNLTVPCGDRFEPIAPCEYEVTDCSKNKYCIPCSASCKGLPNGDVPYPGLENTRFHLHCENGRTTKQKECPIPQVFIPALRTCGVAASNQTGLFLETSTANPSSQTTTSSSSSQTKYSGPSPETTTYEPSQQTTSTPSQQAKTSESFQQPSQLTTTSDPSQLTTTSDPSQQTTTSDPSQQTTTSDQLLDTTTQSGFQNNFKVETTPSATTKAVFVGNEQCACMHEIRPLNETLMDLMENMTSLNQKVNNMLPSPYDCVSPPAVANSVITEISYEADVAVATYTCNPGYSSCGSELKSTCRGDNSWILETMENCVQDTWSHMSDIKLSCPPMPGSAVSIRGRYIAESFVITLETNDTSYFSLIVTPKTGVIKGQNDVTRVVTSSQSPIPLTGELTWAIVMGESEFQIFVNGHKVASVPHTENLSLLEKVYINSAFLSDQVRYHATGVTSSEHHPLTGNLAEGKPASASSSYQSVNPNWASDGDTNVNWGGNSCWSANTGDLKPWWQVDLGMEYYVSNLVVTNRFCMGSCADRLHDFQIDAFKDDPSFNPKAEKETCFLYAGIFPSASYQRIDCDFPVVGRYIRISGLNTSDANDLLTLCEVEVYGGSIQAKGWSPFSCPDPPLVEGATVQLSYTMNKAVATYTCLGSDVMCAKTDVITCSSDVGWIKSPGICIKTQLDKKRGDKVSKIDLCPLNLGGVIEVWAVPRNGSDASLILQNMDDILFRLQLDLQRSEKSVSLSHNISRAPSPIMNPLSNPFTVDEESHIVLTLLTDHLLLEVDDTIIYKYPLTGTHPHKAQLLTAGRDLEIRKVKIHNDIEADVITESVADNLALKADVFASSVYGSLPDLAVDGNPSNTLGRSSCWHAQTGDKNQWYLVDLGKHYYIREIKLDIKNECPGCDNVALTKLASGNTIGWMFSPIYAVDGNLVTDPTAGNCFTSSPTDPSLVIDLGRSYNISSVALQRGTQELPESLSDISITVYAKTAAVTTVCTQKSGVLGDFDRLVCDRPVTGRFVKIERMTGVNKGSITLCEVEVYAVVEDKLHDFSVSIYTDKPDNSAVGNLCTKYAGDIPKTGTTTLQCMDGVWGRYVRIQADDLFDQNDLMTICEVEVYGDKAIKKEWSPFECPSPPLHPKSRVSVSYTETEAVAIYKCIDTFSTCNGLNTITCHSSQGWVDNADMCVKTVFTANDGGGLGIVTLPCPLQLGEAIEIFVTPNSSESVISFLDNTTQDTIIEMYLKFSDPINQLELYTYPMPTPSVVNVPDVPFTQGKESRVVLTFLSDHVDVAVDGKSIYAYPNHLSPHFVDTISTSAHVRKLALLPAGNIKTKLDPVPGNLAKSRPASASSDYLNVNARRAVDGDTSTDWNSTSCWASKEGDLDPWWQVELDSDYHISHVEIVARGGCPEACSKRLHDFVIEVFYRDPQPGDVGTVCVKYDGVFPAGTRETLQCTTTVYGRYVRISSPERTDPNDIFQLCEVEVFGGKIVMKESDSFNCKTPPQRPNSMVDVTTTSNGLVARYSCEAGYELCGESTPSHCVNGIWDDFRIQCFRNVWHYSTTGGLYQHDLSCPLALNSEVRVIATPTDNTGFSVELESSPGKKILVVEASFTDNIVTLMVKDGEKVVKKRTPNTFPFEIGKEFQLEGTVLNDNIEVSIDGIKLHDVPKRLSMKGTPSLTTSNIAAREVRYTRSNKATDIIHFTSVETPWIHLPTQGVNHKLFQVKACENVLVELQRSETSSEKVTFTIGGRQNTLSECTSCTPDKMTAWHKPLSCNYYKDFWVSWATPGKVSVGTGQTVGVNPFIEDVPVDFDVNVLHVGTNGTDGQWIFPDSEGTTGPEETCPKPPTVSPLEISKHVIESDVVTTEYSCAENYMFCGESSTATCDSGVPITQVKGACELSRIPAASGPETSMDLPCIMAESSSISAYITPTNSTGTILMEVSGSTGKSIQFHIDMATEILSLTSVMADGTVTTPQTISNFPFILEQETHVLIIYIHGKYEINIDGVKVDSYIPQMAHKKMSTFTIYHDYTLRDLQIFPNKGAQTAVNCETATLLNTVIMATNTLPGGEATLQCEPDYRICSLDKTIKCGSDGEWVIAPEQTCKQYKWTDVPTLRMPIMKSPPCPLASGMAITLVASTAHGFWFDLRAGSEAQFLLQYEVRMTPLIRMTTAILDNVLFEKVIQNPPIKVNEVFKLVVELHDTMYSIIVDGNHLYDYEYLTPVNRTEYLIITTGVTITDLEFMDAIPPRTPYVL